MANSVQKRATTWLLGDDTGMSSMMLCAHMLGLKPARNTPPSDADDRGRCIRLLQLIPEWTERLDEMKEYPDKETAVFSNGKFENRKYGWSIQVELIKKEMDS